MNKLSLNLDAKSPTGDGHITIAPFVTVDGVPKLVLVIRTDVASVYEAKLDGRPAIAVFLGEEPNGRDNTPWELGHLLAQQWDEAEKMAATQKQQ